MHQSDYSIIEKSNIQSDVIVVNQCDQDKREEFSFFNKNGEKCHVIFISTTERGLSRSRNMAIRNATADICLICDDDEIFKDDYVESIINAYEAAPENDFILFNIIDRFRSFPSKPYRVNRIKALKVASWQISFRRSSVNRCGIGLDESMGAGVTMGGGEENRFILDCLRNGLKGIYIPTIIARVLQETSTWDLNDGNCSKYFHDRGEAYRKILGKFWGTAYIVYSSVRKRQYYTRFLPLNKCVSLQFKGLFGR